MKPRSFRFWLGILLFFAGVFIGLLLSGGILWGEVESSLRTAFLSDEDLHVKCPLMLSPAESGIISAVIVNSTDEEIKPVLSAEISHNNGFRIVRQTLSLAPRETQTFQWTVDSSDMIFNRLILVNISLARYRDNLSQLGTCGIIFFSLFGLTGAQSFGLAFAGSIISIIAGGALWMRDRRPLNELDTNISRINSLLAGAMFISLLSSILRWWGLILLLDSFSLLIIGVIITDFVLFPKNRN